MAEIASGPLQGIRVVDLSDEKGAHCTKLLADLGADVIKVEPPEGDRLRFKPPFKDDRPDPETSLHFAFYHANKRGITLDLRRPESRPALRKLVGSADILVESFTPLEAKAKGVSGAALRRYSPGLIHCSVTSFGKTGPYRNFRSTHLTSHALGGGMYSQGRPEGPPVTIPGNQMYDVAGIHAAYGILVALRNRPVVGGQFLDMSVHEVMASQNHSILNYAALGSITRRTGGAQAAPPSGTWRTKDGLVEINVVQPGHWAGFPQLFNSPQELMDPRWADRDQRSAHAAEFRKILEPYFLDGAKGEIADRAQALHIPAAPINTIRDYIEDAHTRARDSFVSVTHPSLGTYQMPGAPYLVSEPIWSIRRPAPSLGEHNEAIYIDELGFSATQVASWRASGVVYPEDP